MKDNEVKDRYESIPDYETIQHATTTELSNEQIREVQDAFTDAVNSGRDVARIDILMFNTSQVETLMNVLIDKGFLPKFNTNKIIDVPLHTNLTRKRSDN